ncbi:MAG: hypothetical protein ACOVN3_00085 [Limnohabitans sp.]
MSYASLHLRLWAKRLSMGCWHIFALSIFTALLISACGGGTSTTSVADPTDPNNITSDPITPPVVNPNTSTTVSPGVYSALWNGKEITSIVMRTSNAANDTAQLYALQFNSPDPDIYAGTAKGIGTNNATISNLTFFQNVSGTLRAGSAALSVPSAGLLKTVVSYAATPTEGARDLTWYANPDNALKLDTPATASQLAGRWTGRWTYAFGFVENLSLTFTADPSTAEPNKLSTTSSTFFQQDCQMTLGEAKPALGGVNLFTVSFKVPSATQCFLKNQTLIGVAYVTSSPVTGKTQRLQWLAVAPDGRGVSFRADR